MFKNEHGEVGCKRRNIDFVMEKEGKGHEFVTIRMLGGGKGILDGELVGHVGQEVVGSEETRVMIGWSGIQWGNSLFNAALL